MASRPRVLFIGYGAVLPVTFGGRMAQYGYLHPLTQRFQVDTIMVPFREPRRVTGMPQGGLSRDIGYALLGLRDDGRLYREIGSQAPYDAIVTVYPLDPARVGYRTRILKLNFDRQSRQVLEYPDLAPFAPHLREFEDALDAGYHRAVYSSPLDQAETWVPFHVGMRDREPYRGFRTVVLAGSAGWHRFQRALDLLLAQLDELDGTLYLYANLTDRIAHPKLIQHFDPEGYQGDRCSFSIQPLDYHSGIPAKSLESLARGIPVLTTPGMKEQCFGGHRHVHAAVSMAAVNHHLDQDPRHLAGVWEEIRDDLEAERGCAEVGRRMEALLFD